MRVELSVKFCSVVAVELMKDRSHNSLSLFTIEGQSHEEWHVRNALLYLDHVNAYAYSSTSTVHLTSTSHQGTCTPPRSLIQAVPAAPSDLHVE
jgi:hypothetical protein